MNKFAELQHWFFQKLNPEQREGFLFVCGVPKGLSLNMQTQALRLIANRLAEDEQRDELIKAYIAGATDVHENWQEDRDPDFTEAAHDYAASVAETAWRVVNPVEHAPPITGATQNVLAENERGERFYVPPDWIERGRP